MKNPGKRLTDTARASIQSLSIHPHYGSLNKVCIELSKISGLGLSTILKFYDETKPNLTVATLDRLVAAIRTATRKAAA